MEVNMKRIVVVFPPERLNEVKDVLYTLNVGGMLIQRVTGVGLERGDIKKKRKVFHEYDKIKVEVVVREDEVDRAVEMLLGTLQTGKIGDGKIFIYPGVDVVRIRTGERGEEAV